MSYLPDMMQPPIRVALSKWSHIEPEWGFEPGSAAYKATVLPFELSSIDYPSKLGYWISSVFYYFQILGKKYSDCKCNLVISFYMRWDTKYMCSTNHFNILIFWHHYELFKMISLGQRIFKKWLMHVNPVF